jgi:ribonuclease P protein component
VVIHSLPNSLGQVRLGLAVGRRFGRAVSRNRLRRRMREAVREQAPRIRDGVDLVLTPTAAARNATFGALFQSVTAALAASHLLADAPGGPSTC